MCLKLWNSALYEIANNDSRRGMKITVGEIIISYSYSTLGSSIIYANNVGSSLRNLVWFSGDYVGAGRGDRPSRDLKTCLKNKLILRISLQLVTTTGKKVQNPTQLPQPKGFLDRLDLPLVKFTRSGAVSRARRPSQISETQSVWYKLKKFFF